MTPAARWRAGGRHVALLLAMVLGLAACGSAAMGSSSARAAGTRQFSLRSGGHERTYLVAAPSGSPRTPRPLVLVLHGADDSAASTVTQTDFAATAQSDGAIVAYLQGYENTWNEGAGGTPARRAGIDDVAYVHAVLRALESRYPVDRSRIAAVGFSNGALMTQLLGCRLATWLTTIVPVEGQLPVSVSPGCAPARPISVDEIHATADSVIPYGGGPFAGVGGGTTVLSAPDSAARWATLDHCTATSTTTVSSLSSVLTEHTGCAAGTSVTLDTIEGGSHQWPADIGQLVAQALQTPASRPAARA
jgi:polyhydroxybutyrate depolymerase